MAMPCFGACSKPQVLDDTLASTFRSQSRRVLESAPSVSGAADSTPPKGTEHCSTQQAGFATIKQHHQPFGENSDRACASGYVHMGASAAADSIASKQEAESEQSDSSWYSAEAVDLCSSIKVHAPTADDSLFSFAAPATRFPSQAVQQTAFFAPVALPRRAQASAVFAPATLPSPARCTHGVRGAGGTRSAKAFQALAALQPPVTASLDPDQVSLLIPPQQMDWQVSSPMAQGDKLGNGVSDTPNPTLSALWFGQQAASDNSFSLDLKKSGSLAAKRKEFLGQRASDIRRSLDYDFDSEPLVATTRRSKDYGERNQALASCRGAKSDFPTVVTRQSKDYPRP